MLIYEALKNDHDKVKSLLKELVALEDSDVKRRNQLVSQIADELVPHSRAEEAVFYNSMRLLDASKSLAMHGYKEHMEAEALLRLLQTEELLHMGWKATAVKLKEAIEHHIEEEEGEMFEAARAMFTRIEAESMTDAFEQMKPEIKKGGMVVSTVEMIANLMPPRFSDKFRSSPTATKRN